MYLSKSNIDTYIKAHELAWAPTSLKSERARLEALLDTPYTQITDDPASLFKALTPIYKPYTIKTLFIRLGDFYEFFKGPTIYREFLKSHRNLFKSAYTSETLHDDFSSALQKIHRIENRAHRNAALTLLNTGLRISELAAIKGDKVIGKGNKTRPLFGQVEATEPVPASSLWLALKKVGLKPHTLRKLFATRLLERGLDLHNVCQIMGWSNYNTAQRYLQPKREEELRAFVKGALA